MMVGYVLRVASGVLAGVAIVFLFLALALASSGQPILPERPRAAYVVECPEGEQARCHGLRIGNWTFVTVGDDHLEIIGPTGRVALEVREP